MAQEMRPVPGGNGRQSASGQKTTQDETDGDRAQTADLGNEAGADFQVSLASATSIAGLTAYASPIPELANYVAGDDPATSNLTPFAFDASDRAPGTSMSPRAESGDTILSNDAPPPEASQSQTHPSAAQSASAPQSSSAGITGPTSTPSTQTASAAADDRPTGPQASSPEASSDDAPDTKDTWTPGQDLSATVLEHSDSGTEALVLAETDAYGDRILYQITDAEGTPITDSAFEILGNTLVVADGNGLNFESDPEQTVYLIATTEGGTSGPWPVAVTLTDDAEDLILPDGGDGFVDTGVAETSITGGAGDDAITGHADGATLDGAAGEDTLFGGDGADDLTGGSGGDHLSAGDADDDLTGGAGDDYLDGGAGEDTAFFTGAWSDYTITEAGGVYIVTDNRPGSPDGTDHLTNIENLDFADGRLTVVDALNDAPDLVASDGTITENDAGAVVGSVTTTDADAGDSVTFTVDDARFDVVDGALQLRDGQTLDFESDGETVNVTVTATDTHGASDSQTVTVTVADAAEVITLDDGGQGFVDTGSAETSITGGDGSDTITGHDDGAQIGGGAGDDILEGGTGDDVLTGGDGDDQITGGDGTDRATWDGPLGDFAITYDPDTGVFTVSDENADNGAEGRDTVTGVETFVFDGTDYTPDDLIAVADEQANTAPTDITVDSGGSVGETVASGGTVDTANDPSGTAIATLATSDSAGDTHSYTLVNDPSGHFEIVGNEVRVRTGQIIDFETTESFDLTIQSTDQYGASVEQVLTFHVDDFEGLYTGGDGGETIVGTSEEDAITGGAGDDDLTGGAGDDTLIGGGGSDRFQIAETDGSDVISGGAGDADQISFSNSGGAGGIDVTFTGDGAGTYAFSGGDANGTFDGIEAVDGTDGADTLDGSATTQALTLTAGDGDDVATGGAGVDILDAGAGDDTLFGGSGDDTLQGGDGTDVAVFSGDWSDYTITESGGVFTVVDNRADSPDGTDTIDGIEIFRFADGDRTATDALNDAPEVTAADGSAAENDTGAIVGAVSTTDADAGDRVTYSVDDARFEVVGGQLKLKDGQSLDFEDVDSVTVTVTATDVHGATDSQLVTVTVDDVAEDIVLGDADESFTDTGVAETSITGGDGADTITGHDDGSLIDGGAGDDVIDSGAGNDTVTGGVGDDVVSGNDGHDVILGGGGADDLAGNDGDDTIDGGDGNDTLYGGAGDDLFSGGAGDDSLYGGDGSDTAIYDGDFADFAITYDVGTQTFTITDLNAGDEDEGTDTVTGVETFTFDGVDYTSGDLITEADRQANTGPGQAAITTGGDVDENASSGTVVATLTAADPDGDALTYTLTDAAGNPVTDSNFEIVGDEIRARDGADIDFEDSSSFDLYVVSSDDFESSAPQAITVTVNDRAEVHQLDDGGQNFTDTGVTEIIVNGGTGDDTITGSGGDDLLKGAAGSDSLAGGDGNDALYGHWVVGRAETAGNQLSGGAGDDSLFGASGDDTLLGGDGDDYLEGWAGDDTIDGGDGNDVAEFSGNWSDYTITESGGVFTVVDNRAGSPDGTDTIEGVEVFRFADADVTATDALNDAPEVTAADGSVTENDAGAIVGAVSSTDADAGDSVTYSVDDARFEVVGGQLKLKDGESLDFEDADSVAVTVTATDVHGATDSQVVSVTVNDQAEDIQLGDGGESFTDTGVAETSTTGGNGADTITGHDDGSDIGGGAGDDLLTGGAGDDTIDGGDGYNVIVGGAGDDQITGGNDGNYIDGGAGNDTVTGGVGEDFISGNDGNDSIYGGNRADDLSGNDGDDTLDGGDGNDTLYGGAGDDVLDAGEEANYGDDDELYGGVGNDTLTSSETDSRSEDYFDGGSGNDVITSQGGDDTLVGGTGDDTLSGGTGDDLITGGDDTDTAEWSGDLADFSIGYDTRTETFTVTDNNAGDSDEGTDTVTGVETFTFNGVDYTAADIIQVARDQNEAPENLSTNLLDNGSFDDGLEGWSNSGAVQGRTRTFSSSDDTTHAQFGAGGQDDGQISQTFETVVGETYTLTFDYGASGATWSQEINVTVEGASTLVSDSVLEVAGSDIDYQTYTYTFVADSTSTTLTFDDTSYASTNRDAYLNDVSVVHETAVDDGTTEVTENATSGSIAGIVDAYDPEGNEITYMITDSSGNEITDSNFEIVGSEIRVRDGADLDFESSASHDVYVVAYDGLESGPPTLITVNVADAAEAIQLADGGVTFSDTGVAETSITGGDGADDITAHDDGSLIDGGAGGDQLTGGAGADTMSGGDGFNIIDGNGGNDVLTGGNDGNVIDGGDGNDTVMGGFGTDFLFGEDGNDFVSGSAGDDFIGGEDGDDTLRGGSGNDELEGGQGDDVIIGESGDDTATWDGDFDDYAVTFDPGTETFTIIDLNTGDGDEGADTVSRVETFSFNGVDYTADQLVAAAATHNYVLNGSFEDTTGGTDTGDGFTFSTLNGWTDANGHTFEIHDDTHVSGLAATDGDHWLDLVENNSDALDITQSIAGLQNGETYDLSFDAADRLGSANLTMDVYFGGVLVGTIDPSTNSNFESFEFELIGGSGDGTNTLRFVDTGGDTQTGISLDNIQIVHAPDTTFTENRNFDIGTAETATYDGTTDPDAYTGTGSSDVIYGRDGQDTLDGAGGDDTIYAGSANDSVEGGAGDDVLFGGDGFDTLSGGAGNDTLYGDAGNDTFSFASLQGNDTVDGGDGWTDVIELAGFSGGYTVTGDTIEGDGWTAILDSGSTVTDQTLDSIELSADATGVITFDDGGTVDFTGIEKIVF